MLTQAELKVITTTRQLVAHTFQNDIGCAQIISTTIVHKDGETLIRLGVSELPLNELCDYLSEMNLNYKIEEFEPSKGAFYDVFIPVERYIAYATYCKIKGGYYD